MTKQPTSWVEPSPAVWAGTAVDPETGRREPAKIVRDESGWYRFLLLPERGGIRAMPVLGREDATRVDPAQVRPPIPEPIRRWLGDAYGLWGAPKCQARRGL